MVVEDSTDLRGALSTLLERNDFEPVAVGTGKEAMRLLFERRPDCVVLDIGLPDIDGWSVLEKVRELSEVPVLMLTARHLEEDKVKALESGADDYLTKPYGSAELVARIRVLLRRNRPVAEQGSDRLEVGPLTINRALAEVRLNGEDLDLTKTEFALLYALAEARPQVLSSTQLLELAWNDPTGIGTDRVKFMIARLRRKLDAVDESSLIESVRGFGYRIRVAA